MLILHSFGRVFRYTLHFFGRVFRYTLHFFGRVLFVSRCKYTTNIWYEQILEQKNKIYFIIEWFLGRIWEFTHDRLPKNSQ